MLKLSYLIIFTFFMATLIGCNGSGQSAQDAFGVRTEPNININLMQISPSNKFLFIGESIQFSVSGGTAPYVFSLDSGAGSVTSTGFYTASAFSGTGVIKAVDAEGKKAFATISISLPISITPTSAVIGGGDTQQFLGSGGIAPYSYQIVAGTGAINNSTGLFDATGVVSGSAVIEVRDSSNNTAYAALTINPSLVLTPLIQTLGFAEVLNFSVSGGNSPYVFSKVAGGGSIDPTTGVFTAPSIPGATIIRVTDSSANAIDAVLTIVDSPQFVSPALKVGIGSTHTYSATNGSPPYQFTKISGGGTFDINTGVFVAPTDTDVTVLQVEDVNLYTNIITVNTFVPKLLGLGARNSCQIDFSNITTSISKCWGRDIADVNTRGMIGPIESHYIGDELTDLGDNVPTVNIGNAIQARGIKVDAYSSCAVTTNDKVKCWGYNNYGNLGVGHRTYIGTSPDQMGNSLATTELGTGLTVSNTLAFDDAFDMYYHSACAILSDNTMKCWGLNNNGKLGIGATGHQSDAAGETGDSLPIVQLGPDIPIEVDVGALHVCIRTNTNQVKCWGHGAYGQTGNQTGAQTGDTPVTEPQDFGYVNLGTGRTATNICTGYYHSCAVLDTGEVKCWGRNNYGELGQGHGTLEIGDDPGEMGDSLPIVDLGTGMQAAEVSCQAYSTCARLTDGSVKCWGHNSYGQLGLGHTTQTGKDATYLGDALPPVNLGTGRTATKITAGSFQMCAALDNGQHKCWGRNENAQLAQGHLFDVGESLVSLGDNLPNINLSSTQSITSIQARDYHGCATLSDNTVKCWGLDYYGSRGTGSVFVGDEASDMGANLASLDLTGSNSFKEIKSYLDVTCGRTTDDKLTCWGYSGEGARASGNATTRGYLASHWGAGLEFIDFGFGRTVKEFDVGYRGGCAVLSDDSLKCWGRNANGQLGHEDTTARGDQFVEIGDNFINTNLGTVSYPVQVSVGTHTRCARLNNGNVKCWGYNLYGQLGHGTNTQEGDDIGEMGDNLPWTDLGSASKYVCTGDIQSCSIMANDQVKCWGHAAYNGTTLNTHLGDDAGEMGANLPYLDLGVTDTVKDLQCGRYHTCAILTDDTLKCWGHNSYGQLGQGHTTRLGDTAGEMGNNLDPIDLGAGRTPLKVYVGQFHTCAVLDNNDVKCFGRNDEAQLGLGHRTNMGTLNVTIGDALPKVETD